jgi:hypothetical protein
VSNFDQIVSWIGELSIPAFTALVGVGIALWFLQIRLLAVRKLSSALSKAEERLAQEAKLSAGQLRELQQAEREFREAMATQQRAEDQFLQVLQKYNLALRLGQGGNLIIEPADAQGFVKTPALEKLAENLANSTSASVSTAKEL